MEYWHTHIPRYSLTDEGRNIQVLLGIMKLLAFEILVSFHSKLLTCLYL